MFAEETRAGTRGGRRSGPGRAKVAYSEGARKQHAARFGEDLPTEEVLPIPGPNELSGEAKEALEVLAEAVPGAEALDLTVLKREGAAGDARRRRRGGAGKSFGGSLAGGPARALRGEASGGGGALEVSLKPMPGRATGRRFELSRQPESPADWGVVLSGFASALADQAERDRRRAREEVRRLLDSVRAELDGGVPADRETHPDLMRAGDLEHLLDAEALEELNDLEERWRERHLLRGASIADPDGFDEPFDEDLVGDLDEEVDGTRPSTEEDYPDFDGLADSAARPTPRRQRRPSFRLLSVRRPGRPTLAAVLVFLTLFGGFVGILSWGGPPDETARSAPPVAPPAPEPEPPEQGIPAPAAALAEVSAQDPEVVPTGVVFQRVEADDGTILLSDGEDAWSGRPTETGDGTKIVRFTGPSAGDFASGFDVPGASVSYGNFGYVIPGGALLHSDFHRLKTEAEGEKPSEITRGTYFLVEEGRRTTHGSYVDERPDPDGRVVERTYAEVDEESGEETAWRVSYEAELDTEVPTLVGWPREELDESAGRAPSVEGAPIEEGEGSDE